MNRKNSMRWGAVLLTAGGLMVSGLIEARSEEVASVGQYQKLVSEWVEIKKQTAEERRVWEEEKAAVEQERILIEREKTALGAEIVRLESELSGDQSKKIELTQEKEKYQKIFDSALPPALQRATSELKVWKKLIPPALERSCDELFVKLESPAALSVSQRLKAVLDLHTEIHRLLTGVHLVKQMFALESGQTQEFSVLYLGLACGLALSSDGKTAGIGYATGVEGEWQWFWGNTYHKYVARALAVFKKEKTADYIVLPLRNVKGGGK